MNFTERDADLIRWLNGHGFATIRQVATWMAARYQAAQRRTQLLAEAGYLTHRWPVRGERVYLPTRSAIIRSGDDLPPLGRISLGTYQHNLQLVDLAQRLVDQTGGRFTTDRRLRLARSLEGVGAIGHLPDGLLHNGSDKPIAIELELSTKGRRRLDRIIRGYVRDLSIGEVWYFTGSAMVRRGVERAARGHEFIKIRDWPLDPHNGADERLPVSRPHPSIVSSARIAAS